MYDNSGLTEAQVSISYRILMLGFQDVKTILL